jgi:hypothetical protein
MRDLRVGNRLGLCAVVTAFVAVLGGFAGGFVHGLPVGTAQARAARAEPSSASRPLHSGPSLEAMLVAAPAGAQPDAGSPGAESLDQLVAAHLGGDPSRAALTARGFASAAASGWTMGGDHDAIQLIQFNDAAAAEGFVLSQDFAYTHDSAVTASYAVSAVTAGRGFEMAGRAPAGRAVLVGRVGSVVVEVAVVANGAFDRAADQLLMQRQVAVLAR